MDKFEVARREHYLITKLLEIRDVLEPIVSGVIERGHCVGTREAYGGKPGNRKTTLADAKTIARHAMAHINQSINRFEENKADVQPGEKIDSETMESH